MEALVSSPTLPPPAGPPPSDEVALAAAETGRAAGEGLPVKNALALALRLELRLTPRPVCSLLPLLLLPLPAPFALAIVLAEGSASAPPPTGAVGSSRGGEQSARRGVGGWLLFFGFLHEHFTWRRIA